MLEKELNKSFETAVESVKDEFKKEGFGILGEIQVNKIFREKLGLDYPSYTIIEMCNPKLAKMALDIDKRIGTLFPCTVVIHEEGKTGKVKVLHTSIMKAAVDLGIIKSEAMKDVIAETSRRVQAAWNRL
jgi:uncharacterized protein (DUF302 family)